jgi:hypothetical protein
MSITTTAIAPTLSARLRHRLIRPRIPLATTVPATVPLTDEFESHNAFWRLQNKELNQLRGLNANMNAIAAKVGGEEFLKTIETSTSYEDRQWIGSLVDSLVSELSGVKSALGQLQNITTHWSEEDREILQEAMQDRDDCTVPAQLPAYAFPVIATLNAIAAHLMDLKEVSQDTVLAKLERQVPRLRDKVFNEIESLGAEPLGWLLQATDAEAVRVLPDDELAAWLQRSAALLLKLKLRVACALDPDVPPPQPEPGAIPTAA